MQPVPEEQWAASVQRQGQTPDSEPVPRSRIPTGDKPVYMFLMVGETGAPRENPQDHRENAQTTHKKPYPCQKWNLGNEATVLILSHCAPQRAYLCHLWPVLIGRNWLWSPSISTLHLSTINSTASSAATSLKVSPDNLLCFICLRSLVSCLIRNQCNTNQAE